MNKKMKILVEASGCLTAGYLIKYIQKAGNICVGTDVCEDCFGKYLADEFYSVPFASDENSPNYLKQLVIDKKVDMVIPTLDDGLLNWANMKDELAENGVVVATSSAETLEIFLDKWETFKFFDRNGIPTPKTSLRQEYPLVKPRLGRGGSGIKITNEPVDMQGNISQELLSGTEYTVDVLCNLDGIPVYIVPRIRIGVKDGKATGGQVVKNDEIEAGIRRICSAIKFQGPINVQCFITDFGEISFTEINPRFGGGSVLGMAATENWMPLLVDMFINGKEIKPATDIKYGLKMGRYYDEVFYF